MLFKLGLVSTFLLALAVLAHPLQDSKHLLSTRDLSSGNWAGVEYYGEGEGAFTIISGTFYAPGINTRKARFESPISIFAGFDGLLCPNAWFRAGIDIHPGKDGHPNYKAYFEAHPGNGKQYFKDISVSAGDKIKLTSFVPATTSGLQRLGFAVVENLSKKQSVAEEIPFNGDQTLCGQDTMLIVESDAHVPDFGTVEFTDIQAYTARDPSRSSSAAAVLLQLQRGGPILVQTLDKNNNILVTYQ